jgi:hypothetical protein
MFIVRSFIWLILQISFKDRIHPLMQTDAYTIILISDLLFGLYLPADHFYFILHFITAIERPEFD